MRCVEHGQTLDVDECLDNNGGCEYICTNTIGSFECSCQPGYDLDSDGLACIGMQLCTCSYVVINY